MNPFESAAPKPVDLAIRLLWIALAISGVSILWGVGSTVVVAMRLLDRARDLSDAMPTIVMLVTTLATTAVTVAIEVVFILLLRRRVAWARIVYLVLYGLGLVWWLYMIVTSEWGSIFLVLLGLVPTLLRGVALFQLFRPESGRWFAGAPERPTATPAATAKATARAARGDVRRESATDVAALTPLQAFASGRRDALRDDDAAGTPRRPPPSPESVRSRHEGASMQIRCPVCSSEAGLFIDKRMSAGGWVLFVVLLLFCFPLCWLPFVIDACKEETRKCMSCGSRIG